MIFGACDRRLARVGLLAGPPMTCPAFMTIKFNPTGKSWLPIMHTGREGWNFTTLFSNTALAHELNKTNDWVVVYYERDGREGQCTVVTEQGDPLKGQRVIRGRE
jgi:hypothetical protein